MGMDGVRERLAEFLAGEKGSADRAEVERQVEALRRCGATLVARADEAYPVRLRPAPAAPELLFVRGDVRIASQPAVAIVGTRKPSAAGAALATRLARSLAMRGVTVVSGLARGIDTAAHQGALDVGGETVAVVGTGIDVVYPPENGALMRRVAERGCILSEQACGTPAFAHVFPKRNRIISGVCEAVVVVEGGARSGALITAQWALEQGRDVGAVPGFPGDFRSAGPNRLLREGAFLVEDADDVIGNVGALATLVRRPPAEGRARGAMAPGAFDADTARVFQLVGKDVTADEIARAAGMDVERALEILARLEIDGHVTRDVMDRFTRAAR
jgi:DNA processing protein